MGVEALCESVRRAGSCPFRSPDPKSREVSVRDPVKTRHLARSAIAAPPVKGRWAGGVPGGSLLICALCLRSLPRPSRWMASFSFVHHPLPEKWSLPPSLDTVRSSEEENLGL